MSVSSSSPDNNKNILSQVITSTPQAVPTPDKLAGNEIKQVQQTRQGANTDMQSDTAIAGTHGKNRASEAQTAEEATDLMEQQGLAAQAKTAPEQQQGITASANSISTQASVEQASKTLSTSSLSSLSSTDSANLQEIQSIVSSATSQSASVKQLEVPDLPKPSKTPRQDVSEISMAIAKAITALGESTAAALADYQSTQAQSSQMNKMSLESQSVKIDNERAEFQKMREIEAKSSSNQTLETVNNVMMGISIAITVISVVSALFTCGLGLIGTAAAAGTAVAAAGTAVATSAATTVATQVATQTIVQVVKQAIVTAVKNAVMSAVKQAVKQGVKKAIQQAVKAAVKTLSKNIGKIFNTGKSQIAKSFPKLSKVMSALGSKWVSAGVGLAIAVPSLVKGVGDLQLSKLQNELADLQRTTGSLSAQSEMMAMFTMFWQQASKIAAKQTGSADEMQQQASKLGAQIAKALSSISTGLAAAV